MTELASRPESKDERAARKVAGSIGNTHEAFATELLAALVEESGTVPIYAEGELWLPDKSGLWRPSHVRRLRNRIAQDLGARKEVSTQRQIAQVAERIIDRCYAPAFFADAVTGIATASKFWTLTNGELTSAPLTLEHRARFRLPIDAAFDSHGVPVASRAFDDFLSATFAPAVDPAAHAVGTAQKRDPRCERAEQIALLQEIFGGALFGLVALLQKVALLIGVTRSGKGTVARLLEALFPPEAICSVAPDRWGHEYHRAALAGKAVNLVGEIDETRPIPASDLKTITGGDLIGARNPSHAQFTFRPRAAHIFSGNTFPAASDRDDAFYGRWLIVEFRNSVAGREDPDLADRLVREALPSILAWALVGATRLAKRGRFSTPATHDRLIERWRIDHSSVLTWLKDAEAIALEPKESVARATAYNAFKAWCRRNERRALGSHTFYAEIRRSAGRYGVVERRAADGWCVDGMRLVRQVDMLGDD